VSLLNRFSKHFSLPWPRKVATGDFCKPITIIFQQFRAVLRADNHALEIIADMGEKLGGEYLFDRHYIETAIEDMVIAVHQAIDRINDLTNGRCKTLYPICDQLASRVRIMMSGLEDWQGPALGWLQEIRPRDWPLVGGKGAHLAEMIHDPAVRVPPGFVITTRMFHDFMDEGGLLPLFARFEAMLTGGVDNEAVLEETRQQLEDMVRVTGPPAAFLDSVGEFLARMTSEAGQPIFLAIRSSAQEEDLDFSFAGQFLSVLQVAGTADQVFAAYRQVAASLFGARAVTYRRQVFPEGGPMAIAVCCQRMVDSRASGVLYTLDPMDPKSQTMVVVGALGQGQAVVEGQVPTDFFRLAKAEPAGILERAVMVKNEALHPTDHGNGLQTRAVSSSEAGLPCLSDAQLQELGRIGLHLENFFKRPQDIEWSVDHGGQMFILQARPLLVTEPDRERRPLSNTLAHYEIIADGEGRSAQQGIGAGKVYRVETPDDIAGLPEGAVLVSHRDSSQFAQVMHRAAAIITEMGSPVSHMSTLCREFVIPCIVGIPNILSRVAQGEEITVDAEDRRVYRGQVVELLTYQATTSINLKVAPEFRLLRRVLKESSRLHLVDPLMQNFQAENCQTFHDILRFIHETAVLELVEVGRDERCVQREHLARRLDLPIMAGILVIDIGGGLRADAPPEAVPVSAIASRPFQAILRGLLYPEVWHQDAMPVSFRDMMNSMLSAPQDAITGQYTGRNIAIISRNYVNLCFRFGYHFNIIDAFCDEVARDNHIYFRFLGGATDLAKRSRRAALLAIILKAFDFNVQTKGDLVIARTSVLDQDEMERTLDILGRLIGFTRQLDVRMDDNAAVERFAEAFLMGDYGIVGR